MNTDTENHTEQMCALMNYSREITLYLPPSQEIEPCWPPRSPRAHVPSQAPQPPPISNHQPGCYSNHFRVGFLQFYQPDVYPLTQL